MKKITKFGISQVPVQSPAWVRKLKNFWVAFSAVAVPAIPQFGFSDLTSVRIAAVMALIGGLILGLQAMTGTGDQQDPYKP